MGGCNAHRELECLLLKMFYFQLDIFSSMPKGIFMYPFVSPSLVYISYIIIWVLWLNPVLLTLYIVYRFYG